MRDFFYTQQKSTINTVPISLFGVRKNDFREQIIHDYNIIINTDIIISTIDAYLIILLINILVFEKLKKYPLLLFKVNYLLVMRKMVFVVGTVIGITAIVALATGGGITVYKNCPESCMYRDIPYDNDEIETVDREKAIEMSKKVHMLYNTKNSIDED